MNVPLPAGPASGSSWRPVPGDKPVDGPHANRSRLLHQLGNPERVGRFKYLRPGTPPVELYTLGIEWVAYALGTVLGVPVAPIYLERYSGIAGALSPLVPNSLSWFLFREAKHPSRPVVNLDDVPLSVVFDIWIANCDRWEKNLLVQSEPADVLLPEAKQHRIWLIDHGTSMLWPPVKFGLCDDGSNLGDAVVGNGDTQAERFIRERILDGPSTKGYWAAFANLSPDDRQGLYRRVQAVDDSTIERAVRMVPGAYMTGQLVELTVQQLKTRRDRVDVLAERLVSS